MRVFSLALALVIAATPPPTNAPAPDPGPPVLRTMAYDRFEVGTMAPEAPAVVIVGMSKVLALASVRYLDTSPPGIAVGTTVLWMIDGRHAFNADPLGGAGDLAETGQQSQRTASQRTSAYTTHDIREDSTSHSARGGTFGKRWHDMASGTGIPIRV